MAEQEDATIDQLVRIYDRHDERTTHVQRTVNRATSTLGKPMSLVVIFGLAIIWVVGNYVARAMGSTAL